MRRLSRPERAQRKNSDHKLLRALLVLAVTSAVIALGCGAKEDPFAVGDRAAPTPPPQVEEAQPSIVAEEAAAAVAPDVQEEEGSEDKPIKIVEGDDKIISLSGFIAGYVIAHGLDHSVRQVDMETADYRKALPLGEVDVLLETAPGWYDAHVESGDIIALGSPFQDNAEAQIVVHSSLRERAPDVVLFLEKFQIEDEVLAKLAARITGGRAGLSTNVAGLIFLKANEEIWTQWVDEVIVEHVKAAIEDGFNSLCREWVLHLGGERFRVCKDDPTIRTNLG